jgi:endonuclease/exonuclease/phosphatase family metal-dependent hydrolase
MIELHKPDAFGLQEAMLPHMQYIDSVCPQYARVGVGRSDGKEGGEFVTIYYNKERFDLLDSGTFWLSETPDQVSRGWDAALPRITTWVKLRDKATKRKFFYFNTHFDHKGTTARVESSKLIVEKIREIAGKKAMVVLTGDFNIENENEALQPLYDNMSAARRCAPITDNKGTYNGWGLLKRNTVIDHIFYDGRKVKCNAFRTLDGDYGAKFISDHFPLEAIFTIR